MVRKSDSQYDTFDIPIHEIWVDDEFNCREGITRESVESLVQSIDREGLTFPVDVQSCEEVENIPKGFKFRLVSGFRRLTSCKILGWTSIPARVREGLTERGAAFMNLAENLERKDLNILEEALALDRLFPIYRTPQSVSKELNKSVSWVTIRRLLLIFPAWMQKVAASGRFSERDLRVIQRSNHPEEKAKEILRAAKSGNKAKALGRNPTKRKSEIKEVMVSMLEEGFSPELVRPLGWTIGEVSDEDLENAIVWLRDRKGWLK